MHAEGGRRATQRRQQPAGTSGDSEIRLSPAKPEPDQKKARRVKRRRGPRRTRLGPSPNETETKDDAQRLDEKPACSAGDGGAAKHFETAEPAPPAPSDSGAASQAIMSALACRSAVAAAALIAAIGATLAAGVTEWAGAGI